MKYVAKVIPGLTYALINFDINSYEMSAQMKLIGIVYIQTYIIQTFKTYTTFLLAFYLMAHYKNGLRIEGVVCIFIR